MKEGISDLSFYDKSQKHEKKAGLFFNWCGGGWKQTYSFDNNLVYFLILFPMPVMWY